MSARINEIKLDLEDLNTLLESATRQKSKDLLGLEIRKLQTELINIQNKSESAQQNKVTKPVSNSNPKCYDIKLKNYAWDQTNDFTKIYVTLNNVQSLPKEAVSCEYTERSMILYVNGLDNKNYELPINNLSENIIPSKSHVKVKTDMVIVYLAKENSKKWSCITKIEKAMKDAKSAPPPMGDNDDPNAALMNMMKKMYDEGDDEMKKTIAKAWTEGQDKKKNLDFPSL